MVPSANSYFAPRHPNRKTFIPTSDGTWSQFLDADRLFPSGNQTSSFLIRDLSGQGRGNGEEVGAAALNNGFLMDLEKLCCVSGGLLKPYHLLGAGHGKGKSGGTAHLLI